MLTQAQARIQFVNWLQENHPALAAAAINAAQSDTVSVNGLGQFSFTTAIKETADTAAQTGGSIWEKLTGAATALGTSYLALKNQRDMMKINIARAEQGLPPLDVATSAPVVRAQVDIDPALARDLASNVGSTLNRTLLIGGAAVIALILFMNR